MIEIDARGMRCPWPALRLARAMRDLPAVRIIADDPAAAREIAALAHAHGWQLTRDGTSFAITKLARSVTVGSR